MEPSKKRMRFRYEDDVILLREIVSRDPFSNGQRAWDEIKLNMMSLTKKDFTIKSIRQHIQILMDQWKKTETKHEKR